MTYLANRILAYNQGRIPALLAYKYAGMRENPFRFLRGTCHLFYQDLAARPALPASPPVWLCGDLHLENFGCYQADNGLAYFDLNDFDEALLGPALWDLARVLVSLLVAAPDVLQASPELAWQLTKDFVGHYRRHLQTGKAGMVERRTARGLVRAFMRSVGRRKRGYLLDKRTHWQGKRRRLLTDGVRALPLPPDQRAAIADQVHQWAARQFETPAQHQFYEVEDAAYRIAGTGSMGLARYVLLVRGKGGANGHFLFDLKAAQPSALLPFVAQAQPHWATEAQRMIAVQQRVQFASPALLTSLEIEGNSFIIKQLQPSADKMDLSLCQGHPGRLGKVLAQFAHIVASGHLRASGRQGSAPADGLIDFAHQTDWLDPLLTYVRAYARQVQQDYSEFVAAAPFKS
jgi:uncharacterized protein (DUF2252 family)